MPIDRATLASAFEELKDHPFPGHPEDPELAGWILDLAELDGHIAGLASTALSSSRAQPVSIREVADHAQRLREISVAGDDDRIYYECVSYIQLLQRLEDALCDRRASDG